MVTTLIRERRTAKPAYKERPMMYILSSADRKVMGDYSRTHYTCLVNGIVNSGISANENDSIQHVVPEALGLMVIGDSTEDIWADMQAPCRFCGEGDRPPSRMDRNFEEYYAEQGERKGGAPSA